ncbi:uncharacterized protein TNIN_100121 [Trichonephila inaurata madagascariensis]|uniref:Uncharacterized protein n=1 Tax=Trichonephila inaurata madagascariensis TaxID=2747483 RepID=A0A8X7C5A0_9ARAC|nr:uncharacterized protein TNIN_100121 [Trichonephila inaurata madagascariensis]
MTKRTLQMLLPVDSRTLEKVKEPLKKKNKETGDYRPWSQNAPRGAEKRRTDCTLFGRKHIVSNSKGQKFFTRGFSFTSSSIRTGKFTQLYVLDLDLATFRRMERRENSECNPELMRNIDEIIRRVKPFADAYKMMWELEQQVLCEGRHETSENVTVYISDEIFDSTREI